MYNSSGALSRDEPGPSWIINSDGTDVRSFPSDGIELHVSPNGRKIASLDFDGIKIMRPNGRVISTLEDENAFFARWSPDSQAIAWKTSDREAGTNSLIVANGLAQNPINVFTSEERIEYQWSPDGSRIVSSDGSSVSLAFADGSSPRLLSSGSSPTWSADGSRIAWLDGGSIRIADSEGSIVRRIAANRITDSVNQLTWSPNGRFIAWSDDTAVQLIRSTGGTPRRLPAGPNVDGGVKFSFSPDGDHLAYTNDDQIWVARGNGTNARLSWDSIRNSDEALAGPNWSPDSAVFAVETFSDIIVSSDDGSAQKRILNEPFFWYDVFLSGWSPCIFPTPQQGATNDDFENAEFLDGRLGALANGSSESVFGTTENSTSQTNEPPHGEAAFGENFGPANSIWYRWTANADQVIEINSEGSEVGTVLAVYVGQTLPQLTKVALGMEDNAGLTRVRFAVSDGVTYHLAVDSYAGFDDRFVEGNVQLNFRTPTMNSDECTITGTEGDDELIGTRRADVICGLGGNDKIRGRGGDDIIFAGSGNDFVSGGSGEDVVFGEEGRDVIVGGSDSDLLNGGTQADRLLGSKGDDILFGGAGSDRLFGASGNDKLFGEMGRDRLSGGAGNDDMDGGAFNDTCSDTSGDNTFARC